MKKLLKLFGILCLIGLFCFVALSVLILSEDDTDKRFSGLNLASIVK